MMSSNMGSYTGQIVEKYQIGEQVRLHQDVAVYLAQDAERPLPLYFLVTSTPDGQTNRFKRQMDILAQLSHPGLAAVRETGVTPDKHAFAIVEPVDGLSLAERLAAAPPFTPLQALELAGQLARILAVIHPAGIIHQDLRPDQVILRPDGAPVLVNLGLPGQERPLSTDTNQVSYIAPEQLAGKLPGAQSNIYSVGVMLYEMLAGEPPRILQSEWEMNDLTRPRASIPLQEVRSGLTAVTYTLVRTCLLHKEWSRYDTAEDLLAAIETAVAAETAAQNQPTGLMARFNSSQVWLAVIVIVLVLLGIGGFVFLAR